MHSEWFDCVRPIVVPSNLTESLSYGRPLRNCEFGTEVWEKAPATIRWLTAAGLSAQPITVYEHTRNSGPWDLHRPTAVDVRTALALLPGCWDQFLMWASDMSVAQRRCVSPLKYRFYGSWVSFLPARTADPIWRFDRQSFGVDASTF